MTKQEEIKEGIANELEQPCCVCELEDNCDCLASGIVCPHQEKKADQIIRYLHSQGVVIKVDSNLTIIASDGKRIAFLIKEAGYVAVKPLIEE